jgi:hypothetical protein
MYSTVSRTASVHTCNIHTCNILMYTHSIQDSYLNIHKIKRAINENTSPTSVRCTSIPYRLQQTFAGCNKRSQAQTHTATNVRRHKCTLRQTFATSNCQDSSDRACIHVHECVYCMHPNNKCMRQQSTHLKRYRPMSYAT